MKNRLSVAAGLALILLAVAACGPGADADLSEGGLVAGYAGLVDRLIAAGATVEEAGAVSQEFLSVEGQSLFVDGEQVQVFEYADEAAASADAALVSPDGGSVGTSMITWIAPPHFYRTGRLLVLYLGDNAATLRLLEDALGPQFAGS